MDKQEQTVCAVIVTYNRKELLSECLESLLGQSYPIQGIYIIDNASTDRTLELLKKKSYINSISDCMAVPVESEKSVRMLYERNRKKELTIYYVRMPVNTGGAGGFYEGIKRAYAKGYQWLWLMDDDTVPREDALERLLEGYNALNNKDDVNILASKILWTDGNDHKMNIPAFRFPLKNLLSYADAAAIPIRATSFVSFLMKADSVKRFGLPIKEYFLWNDDAEYTARILRDTKGFLVPASIAIHKTKTNYIPWECVGAVFYYEARNKLWIMRTSSFSFFEKIKILKIFTKNIVRYVSVNGIMAIPVVFRGIRDGLLKRVSS